MSRFIRNLNGFLIGVILICTVALMMGCETVKPYAEFSLGYQIDDNSDWYVQTARDWQCSDNIQFNGELGVEFPQQWSLGYHHQSWLTCGGPFGSGKPELYQDDIRLTKKFGGH